MAKARQDGAERLWVQIRSLQDICGLEFDNVEIHGFIFENGGVTADASFYFKFTPIKDDDTPDIKKAWYTEIRSSVMFGKSVDKDRFAKIMTFVQQYNYNMARQEAGDAYVSPCPPKEYHDAGTTAGCRFVPVRKARPVAM